MKFDSFLNEASIKFAPEQEVKSKYKMLFYSEKSCIFAMIK